ncbi:MAG: AEC family transporter [Lachnospiraceae bacterium]|nr:AEC family transporter [Lachnospiraceae bacterium]
MDLLVVFERMLMLLAMMGLGFLCYKLQWLEDNSYKKLSEIVVNIFNPALVINGALTATAAGSTDLFLIKENIKFVIIYFSVNIIVSIPMAMLLGRTKDQKNIFCLMTIFSNVGFMGIPVISSIYGPDCIIYITFYILAYNLLLYTLGTYIAQRGLPKEQKESSLKGLLNIGTVCSLLSIIIFFSGFRPNDAVLTFFDYVGNATIPLSMMVIGASVARLPLKEIISGVRVYLFAGISLLLMPIAASFLFRGLKGDDVIYGIFIIMFGLPVGSIVTMVIKQYGGDESLCSKATIITTLLSILTIPVVAAFL